MYGPLAVRRDVVEVERVGLVGLLHLVHLGRVQPVLGSRESFAEVQVNRVVKISVLTAGQRPPGHKLLGLDCPGAVGPSSSVVAGPERGGEPPSRLGNDIVVSHAYVPVAAGHLMGYAMDPVVRDEVLDFRADRAGLFPGFKILMSVQTGVVLFFPPLPEADLSVRGAGEREHEVRGVLGSLEGDELLTVDFLLLYVLLVEVVLIEVLAIEHDAVEAVLALLEGSDRAVLLVDLRVIPLHDGEARHGLSRNSLALALLPVQHTIGGRLGYLARGIVHKRAHDDVLNRLLEVLLGQLGELLRDELEGIPVGLRFPVLLNGGAHGVNKGVELRGVDVFLLVPVSGREDDIAVSRGRVHTHVEVDQQVELSKRGLPELRLLDERLRDFVRDDAVMGSEYMPEEVLLAPGGRTKRVRPPYEPDSRPVLRSVRVLYGELERAALELLHDIVDYFGVRLGASPLGFLDHGDGALVELREARHPAQPYGSCVVVVGVLELELVLVWHIVVLGYGAVVLVHACDGIPEARAARESGRPDPVQRMGYLAP